MLRAGLVLSVVFLAAGNLFAQGTTTKKTQPPKTTPPATKTQPPKTTAPATPAAPATPKAAFDAKLAEWKAVMKDLRKVKTQFQAVGPAEQKQFQAQWDQLVKKGNTELLPQLRTLGLAAYKEAPNTDPQVDNFLAKIAADATAADRYGPAMEIAQAMIEGQSDVKEIWLVAAVSAWSTDDFAKCEEYLKKAKELGLIPDQLNQDPQATSYSLADRAKIIELSLPDYLKFGEEEQEVRKAEAEAKDQDQLPRVKLETTKGTIVIELFENEAPNTVANFVSLVESKFYDGLAFHRVLANFMAQGGDPKGDGSGGPDYRIACECYKPNFRKHFEGTLSMAHAGRNTGGSQFFITFVPTPHLNGLHTAFGRVVEGMDVLAELQRRNPTDMDIPADKILKAEVIRKRAHEYKPEKFDPSKPASTDDDPTPDKPAVPAGDKTEKPAEKKAEETPEEK